MVSGEFFDVDREFVGQDVTYAIGVDNKNHKVPDGTDMINAHFGVSNKLVKQAKKRKIMYNSYTINQDWIFTQQWCLGIYNC